jgi:hypothetical protein
VTTPLNQINATANSGETWGSALDKMNQAINTISTQVFTANARANGSITTGNAYGNGIFSFTTLTTDGSLRGGNVQSSANLSIQSNAVVGNSTANIFLGFGIFNVSGVFNVNSTVATMGSNVNINVSSVMIGNSTINAVLTAAGLILSGNLALNSTSVSFGNSTINAVMNSSAIGIGATAIGPGQISIGNSTVNGVMNSTTLVVGTGNFTGVNAGANVNLTTAGLQVGNSTINAQVNSSTLTVPTGNFTGLNVGSNVHLTTAGLQVGNSTVNVTVNSTTAVFGSNLSINSSALSVGNTTVNVTINSSAIFLNGGLYGGISVANDNVSIGTDATLNLIGGTGVTLSVSHDAADHQINVIINSTGGGGGGANTIDMLVSNTLTVGNSTVNVFSNSSYLKVAALNATSIAIGANVNVNTSLILIGNSTVNTQINSSVLSTTTGNFTGVNAGANVNLTTSGLQVGNSTINAQVNSSVLIIGTGSFTANISVGANLNVNTSQISIGNATVNVVVNSSSVFIGSLVQLGNTAISVGNSTVNTVINSTAILSNQIILDQTASVIQSFIASTTTGTSQQVLDNFTLASYRGAKYTLTINDNAANGHQMVEVLVMHDGTATHFTEYAILISNASLGSLTAGISGANVQLQFTPVSANTTVKGHRTLIAV